MANLTQNRRIRKHDLLQEEIERNWKSILFNMTKETNSLIQYTAWKNDQFLNDKGLVDLEDMTKLNADALAIYLELQGNMAKIAEMFGVVNMDDLAAFQINHDNYLAAHPEVDIVEFDKRFD